MRLEMLCTLVASMAIAHTANGELILPELNEVTVAPGETVAVQWLLDDNTTPLFGYSLDFEATADVDAMGVVLFDDAQTTFFDEQNVITAGGATRDPLFSLITLVGVDLFVSTNTDDGSTVIAESGVNDVLASIVITTSEDAIGTWTIDLGSGTALSDDLGNPIDFDSQSLTIVVVPAPAALWLVMLVGSLPRCRRHDTRLGPR